MIIKKKIPFNSDSFIGIWWTSPNKWPSCSNNLPYSSDNGLVSSISLSLYNSTIKIGKNPLQNFEM